MCFVRYEFAFCLTFAGEGLNRRASELSNQIERRFNLSIRNTFHNTKNRNIMKKFMLLLCMGVFALNVAAQEPVKKSCCKKAKTEKCEKVCDKAEKKCCKKVKACKDGKKCEAMKKCCKKMAEKK